MPSEPNKAKSWQFGLRSLMLTAVVIPILAGVVSGTFGATAQGVAIRVLYPLAPAVGLGLVVIIACVLMAWLLRVLNIK